MPRKLKSKSQDPIRTHVSLSFTAPIELEDPMNEAAAKRNMNRSQYICWLVQQDIYFQQRTPPPPGRNFLPVIPPRIRRSKGGIRS